MSDNHDATYMKVWYWLGGLTALEVGVALSKFLAWNVLVGGLVGLAIVKAILVAAYFMHLNIERKYIWWLLLAAVLFLLVLFYGVAPDIMKSHGVNWKSLDTPPPAAAPAHH